MTKEMSPVSRFTGCAPAIGLLLALIILTAPSAFAHDPGLSAADLRVDKDKIAVRLTFARAEIATIAAVGADRDGQIAPSELDAARVGLESLAKESFLIGAGGKDLTPTAVRIRLGDSNAIHFDLEFPTPVASPIALRSMLFDRLARGHRQFLSLRDADGNVLKQQMLNAANNSVECDLASLVSSQPHPQSFWAFLLLGVEHILMGFDHLAFLFALLLVGGTLRETAKIITSFTVAHSITLALATLDVVRLSPNVVEPLIAASIVYVGLENILRGEIRGRHEIRGRWMLTFAFGLAHGFGFASALKELGIGAGAGAVPPLLSFNLGVEIGQISIAALVLPLIWKLRRHPGFVPRYVPACSILVAAAGAYWLIERTVLK
jgi:hydrogenase/urease accessory protein HupE